MSPKNTGRYEFISEKRKKKPVNKKKTFRKLFFTMSFAVIFGLTASVVMVYVTPKLSAWNEEQDTVDFVIETNDNNQVADDTDASTKEKLTITDLQRIQYELFGVGSAADYSLVKIKGSMTDWKDDNAQKVNSAGGIIISRVKNEILILTEQGVLDGTKNVTVEFYNGDTAYGLVKAYDTDLGIGVIATNISNIPGAAKKTLSVVEFGNSKNLTRGMQTVAVGNPLGYAFSCLTGNVVGLEDTVAYPDREFNVITTDMLSKTYGSGFLLDGNGHLIGVLSHDLDEEGETNTIQAIPIGDLMTEMEALANDQPIPYLGLSITTVSEEIGDDYNLPEGVYVKNLATGSPAIKGGLQVGDVIVQMEDTIITDAASYQQFLEARNPGEKIKIGVMRYTQKSYQKVNLSVTVAEKNKQ